MSLCTIFVDKSNNYILMAADSRACTKINGKYHIVKEIPKIKKINNYLVFGCGNACFVNNVLEKFKENKSDNIHQLKEIIRDTLMNWDSDNDKDIVNSFLVVSTGFEGLNVYSLAQYNNYEVDEFVPDGSDLCYITGGIKGFEAQEFLDNYFNNPKAQYYTSVGDRLNELMNLLSVMYDEFSNETIGGTLSIYKIEMDNTGLAKEVEVRDRDGLLFADTLKPELFANDVTVNFARGGNLTKKAEPYVPYLNAGVQGLDKFFRTVKDPKQAVQMIVKGGISITTPTIALYMMNKDNPHYQDLDNRTKDNYFLIPSGDKDENGYSKTFIKIPKSRELGVVFGALFERALRAKDGDKEAWKGFGGLKGTVATNFAPANPIENSFFSPVFNLASNKDFAGRAIVPQNMVMDNRSPYLQYDEKTSEIAKWVGAKTGLSPKQIDYVVKSYTGVIGQLGIPATTQGGDPLKTITTQFTADPLYSSQTLTNFYDNYDKLQRAATDKNIVEQLPTNGKENVVTDEEALRNKFKKASEQISDLNKQIKQIGATLAPDKETKVRGWRQQIIDIAASANRDIYNP